MSAPEAPARAIRWILVASAIFLGVFFLPRSPLFPRATWGSQLHEEVSDFSTIRIRGDEKIRRMLFVTENGSEQLQSEIDLTDPGTLQVAYTRSLFGSLLLKHPQSRVLVVGLGGGGMIRFLSTHLPETAVEVVEIDPVVIRLAEEYFGTESGGRVEIHEADAFEYLPAAEAGAFDAIYLDAFLRPSSDADEESGAARLKTVAFLETVRDKLVPDGLLACNLISYRETTPGDISALREVFPTVEQFSVPGTGNLIVLASRREIDWTEEDWERRAIELDSKLDVGLSFAKIVAHRKVD